MPVITIAIILFLLFFSVDEVFAMTTTKQTNPGNENDPVWRTCYAVAAAEGFGPADNASTKMNNPGDLSPGDEHGQLTAGPAEFHGGSYLIHFATVEGGWTALHDKIQNIVNGTSTVYSPDWTWLQIAQKYAGNWQAWADNVTSYLGVKTSDRFGDYFGV